MSAKIQVRRDTAANWTAANPVLLRGEIGFEYDTVKLKIGDGTTAWNALAYAVVSQTMVESLIADHADRVDNPHLVTKAQVGLGNVANIAPADLPLSDADIAALASKVDANTGITAGTKTKITYDEKGLVLSGTDAVLSDLGDVDASAPETDDVLRWNGTKWAPGARGSVNAGAGVDLFFSTTASDVSPFHVIQKSPDTATASDEFADVTSSTSPVLVDEYISAELEDTQLDAGIWALETYAYVSTSSGVSKLSFHFLKRTSGGTETALFEMDTGHIDDLSAALYQVSSAQPAYAINTTDRLVIRVYAETDSATTVRVHFVHSGSYPTHVTTPLILHHADLAGLQGGSAGEFYHLTASEYTGVGTGDFVRSSTLSGYVPTGRTVNGHALSADVTVTKSDVGLGSVDNVSAASLRDRSTHTGTQTAATISDFTEAAQDAVGGSLTDSSTIAFAYTDASNAISASVIDGSITNAKVAAGIDASKIDGGNVSNTEFGYLDGVTSSIQSQLDGKQATGNYITALTGDISASGPGSSTATLANSGVTAGTYDQVTVDTKGRVTAGAVKRYVYSTTAQTTNNTVTYANVTGLTSASLPAGLYAFRFDGQYQSAATTTGVGFRITNGTATVSTMYAKWYFSQAADGVNKTFQVDQLNSATNGVSTATLTANTNANISGEGIFRVTVSGTVVIQIRSEVNGSQVLIQPDAVFVIEQIA